MHRPRPVALFALAVAGPFAVTVPVVAAAQVQPDSAGVEAWARGDHAAAIGAWRPAALKGDADAQYNLAQAYKTGRGVGLNLDEAERWLTAAARQDHPEAEADLGVLLFARNKREAAMPWLVRAAARGERRAQYLLGTAHFNGDLAPRDWPRAYALTKRASDQGLDVAAARLAQLDELVPVEDRRAGLALAITMEGDERRVRLGGPVGPPAVAPLRPEGGPVQVAARTPAPAAPPRITAATSPGASAPPRAVAPSRPVTPALPPASGPWRAQLGAFSTPGAARTAWTRIVARLPSLSATGHDIVAAGAVHRLQAGGFASRADADKLCRQVTGAGGACFVIRR